MNAIERLAESLQGLGQTSSSLAQDGRLPTNLPVDFRYLLSLNAEGGYTRDGFHHFFGTSGPVHHNLAKWNEVKLWKTLYDLSDDWFVFAEDILGTQFYFDVRGNRKVVKFLAPGDGSTGLYANSLEDFLEMDVFGSELNNEARALASKFLETSHVTLKPFSHIACKIPPILGGSDRDLQNLELADSLANLQFCGQIVQQVKDLPEGTKIDRIRILDAVQRKA